MNVYLEIAALIGGIYTLVFGLLQETKSITSSILYRVIPVFSGAIMVVYIAVKSGWVAVVSK